jgi:hypothetical protein
MKKYCSLAVLLSFFAFSTAYSQDQSLSEIFQRITDIVKSIEKLSVPSEFQLVIGSAQFNISSDEASATDSYLEIYQGKKLIFRSYKFQDNNNPDYNFTVKITGYKGEGIAIVIYDKDMLDDDIIGYVPVTKLENKT